MGKLETIGEKTDWKGAGAKSSSAVAKSSGREITNLIDLEDNW